MKRNNKEILTIITCAASFSFGWILTVIGFFMPPQGEVSDSVLWILGQSLLYCGACIGISSFYAKKLNDFKTEIRHEIGK